MKTTDPETYRTVNAPRCFFRISPEADAAAFRTVCRDPDALFSGGKQLKHSRTTDAVLTVVPGFSGTLFCKRTNNKGFRFTCRYLFRRARVFRAAAAAARLEKAGIRTPHVFAVGEKRFFGVYLKSGYLLTEAVSRASDTCRMAEREPAETFRIFAGILSAMHRCGVSHGDAKLLNFYLDGEGRPGVWDLDGARIFPEGRVPLKYRREDLCRLIRSVCFCAPEWTAERLIGVYRNLPDREEDLLSSVLRELR